MEYLEDLMGVLCGLSFLVAIIILLYNIGIVIMGADGQRKSRIETVNATLISKEIITKVSTRAPIVNIHYNMKFKLENGEEKVFIVKPENYAVVLEGNIGKLTFKGNKYMGFYIEKVSADEIC